MPATFTRILLHIVFSTKHRAPTITPDIQSRLYDFIGGIIRSERGDLIAIGGMPDHIHLFVRWNTERPIGDLVRNIKSRSSLWIHQTFLDACAFAWQTGYGAFSVSDSRSDAVIKYIDDQPEHHRSLTFLDEFKEFLRRHRVEYDPKYLED